MYMRAARARVAECLQCGRPGGGTEGCGSGRLKDIALDVGMVGFPGAPLEQNAGAEKSPRHASRRVRGSRCLCYAFPGGEGRCPWCFETTIGCSHVTVAPASQSVRCRVFPLATNPRLCPPLQAPSIPEGTSQASFQDCL